MWPSRLRIREIQWIRIREIHRRIMEDLGGFTSKMKGNTIVFRGILSWNMNDVE
jgi:hypothetical protein